MKFIEKDENSIESSSLDRFIFYGLLLILAWVPLPLGSNRPWAWSLLEIWVYFLSALWCLSWLMGRSNFSQAFKNAKPALIMFSVWILYLIIQIIPFPYSFVELLSPERVNSYDLISSGKNLLQLSQDAHSTSVFLMKTIAYVQIFILVLLLVNTSKRVKLLFYIIICSALFQAIYGSLMTLSGFEYGFFVKKFYGIGNATGTFINRNHLAGYLEMSLAIGIGLLIAGLKNNITAKTTVRQFLRNLIQLIFSDKFNLRIYLAFMVIALVMTHSRMGNTAFFSSLFIAGILTLLISRHAARSTVILLFSLIIIDLFIVGAWFGLDKVAERIENTNIETNTRIDVSKYAIDYWRDYYLFGSGGGTFFTVFAKYKGQDVQPYFDHAHNDYLELATETGLIGITTLGMVVILAFRSAVLTLHERKKPLMLGVAFACIMGVVSILMHSLVDFNLQIPSNAILFVVILALGYISLNLEKGYE